MSSEDPDDDRTVIKPAGGGGDAIRGDGAGGVPPTVHPTVAQPAAASVAMSSPGESGNALAEGTCLAEFELVGVLGEGGFGIVYVAQDHSLQRRVALKEYMPSALAAREGGTRVQVRSRRHRETFEAGLRSFVNEARLLAQFDHPSLVKVYRFWEANGTAYMVMPLYEGMTLKDRLRQLGEPPDEAWLMALLAPLTEALAVIHAENCFHRDIAPDNVILLAGSERPLLLDFGAARRVIGDMTQALTVILKPGYAPVEQYAEVPEMRQGAWTDIYALAASVHFAITGRTPPPSVGRLMNDSYVPLSRSAAGRYGDAFLRAIDKALAVRPEDRTATVADLRADLGLPPVGAVETMRSATPAAPAPKAASATPATARSAAVGGTATATAAATATATDGSGKGRLIGAAALVAVAIAASAVFYLRRALEPAATASAPAPPPVAAKAAAAADTAPPSPSPEPQARSFEIGDEYERVIAGQTPGFEVEATPVQSRLRIGQDKLGFSVTSSRDGYVQVLVLGPDGSLLLLFPNAQASSNRIKAGQKLLLPQPGWLLDTVEPAGREDFLVIVSEQPRDYGELSRERDYIFLKLPTGKAGADAAAGWTRSTPLLLGSLKNCPRPDCEAYGAARFGVEVVR